MNKFTQIIFGTDSFREFVDFIKPNEDDMEEMILVDEETKKEKKVKVFSRRKHIKRIKRYGVSRIKWYRRRIMLPFIGKEARQASDLSGVMLDGRKVSYGKEYSNLYFKGIIK
jgi:hypothetical protein